MRCTTRTTIAGGIVLSLLMGAAYAALDGRNGYSASEEFVWGDVRSSIQYDAGFAGTSWDRMDGSGLGLGRPVGGQMAGDGAGNLYYLVWGDNVTSAKTSCSGLIGFDGSSHAHLVQDVWDLDALGDGTNVQGGMRLEQVTVSPTSAGLLTGGHPVVLRHVWNAATQSGYGEVVSVNPTSGAETSIHAWSNRWPRRIAIDDSGTIFALDGEDHTIRRLDWNAADGDYDETAVPTTLAADLGMLVGPDGALYVGDASQSWSYADDAGDVHRIDPVTGASTVWARIQGRSDVHDWTFDATGRLWVGLSTIKGKNGSHFVTEVRAGETSSSGNAISDSSYRPYNLAAGSAGVVLVQEWVDQNGPDSPQDRVLALTPSPGDGGGGDTGGGGRGKGKRK